MTIEAPTPATHPADSDLQDTALRIIDTLMRGYPGALAFRLWNGTRHALGASPTLTLVLRDPSVLRQLVLQPNPVQLADAYFKGLLDFEGELFEVLTLKAHFERLTLGWRDKVALLMGALRLPARANPANAGSWLARRFSHQHTRTTDREAISHHYDVSNAFYRLWLDEQMVYSCAYFRDPAESLEQAQRNKLEHICRKLRLAPGERLLDVGCGWGALVCWAAKHHGVTAHGITLSSKQLEYAQQNIRNQALEGRVTVELRDYRDLPRDARFDKVSSIGMFEHVGLANQAAYLESVMGSLRPGGLFLNHGITHDEDGWNRNAVASQFINRYVFPDGELDRVSNIQLAMERTRFEILDVEGLRPHYALTLRHWVNRLEAQREAAIAEVGETAYRVWRLYMAGCALEFESGGTGIYQILASRPDRGAWPVPLTREDIYR
ncbi:MAG: cyclopropane-fatty-acyl-phospholipid synthase family protein [Pseudomonadota bacterium]